MAGHTFVAVGNYIDRLCFIYHFAIEKLIRELPSFCYGETFENLQICGEIGGNAPIFNKRACQSKRKYCCRNGLQFPFYFAHRIASRLKTTVKRKKVKGKKFRKL